MDSLLKIGILSNQRLILRELISEFFFTFEYSPAIAIELTDYL